MKSLYHQDMYNFNQPVKSYWESTNPEIKFESEILENDDKFDIVVIGGGYSGLSCSLELAKRFHRNVAVIEAGHIGWGSSARNGGFLCMGPTKLSLSQLIKRYGMNEIKHYYKDQVDGSNFTKQLIKEHSIECDVVGNLNYEVAHHPSFTKSIKEYANDISNYFKIKTKFYSKEEFNYVGHTGLEQFGAISYEPGCALNPLKLLVGLANANYENKVKLYSHSKVINVEKNNNDFLIITEKGTIKAKKIVFTTNGFYRDEIINDYKYRIIPAISNIIVTRPLSENELNEYNFKTMNPILNARNLLFYYRLLPDHRLLFGARGDLSGSKISSLKMSKWIEKRLKQIFPKWADVNIDFRWSGFVAVTRKLTPSIGKLDDKEIYHSFGYHANGVNTAPWAGKELANFIAGSNHKEMRVSKVFQGFPKRFPFPFLRLLYIKIVYIYYSLTDK